MLWWHSLSRPLALAGRVPNPNAGSRCTSIDDRWRRTVESQRDHSDNEEDA
jgi:hypothetical protein